MDSKVVLTDKESFQTVRKFCDHRKGVYGIEFDRHSRILISLGFDRKINLWDPYVCKPIETLRGHREPILAAMANGRYNQVVTVSRDRHLKARSLILISKLLRYCNRFGIPGHGDVSRISKTFELRLLPSQAITRLLHLIKKIRDTSLLAVASFSGKMGEIVFVCCTK